MKFSYVMNVTKIDRISHNNNNNNGIFMENSEKLIDCDDNNDSQSSINRRLIRGRILFRRKLR